MDSKNLGEGEVRPILRINCERKNSCAKKRESGEVKGGEELPREQNGRSFTSW